MIKSENIILVLVSVIFVITGCGDQNKTKARNYDGKILFVKEGTISIEQSEAEKKTNSRIFRVDASFNREHGALNDYVLLWSVCETNLETIKPDAFLKLIEINALKEADEKEIANADLCKKMKEGFEKKKKESVEVNGVSIKGNMIFKGDEADYVFKFFTNDMEEGEPFIISDPETGEIFSVAHNYLVKGIKYRLRFQRNCYNCPYTLQNIDKDPYYSLTFEEYFNKYWTKSKSSLYM